MGKKLNLKWVAETIGNDYKKWRRGDIIKIQAQTGTGKTYFIKNTLIPCLAEYERLLYVCNRTHLKRQLKKDLLEQFNKEVPYLKNNKQEYIVDDNGNKILDIDAIDIITTIGNITITSYHAIQSSELDREYDLGFCELDYDYIVMDECHYVFADGGFNNRCRLAFDKLVKNTSHSTIKIFISATMDELEYPIDKSIESCWGKKPKIRNYTTGIDYSYVNAKYFTDLSNIITTIKNDKTDEKWLIFVSDLKDADKIKEQLGEEICSIIKAGDKTDELKSIVANSKFEKKVLITTKALDNGININDDKLTNIVIMAWDRITFIQMLGRKRIDIDNAQEVSLYIPTRYKKSFLSKIKYYDKKREEVELFNKDKNVFNRKYDNSLDSIGKLNDLFYRNHKDGEWNLNKVGNLRLTLDKLFAQKMVEKFNEDGGIAFIKEQLKWLGLEDTLSENNLVDDIISDDETETLEKYLEIVVGERLYSEEQQKISDLIIKKLTTIADDVDYRTKKLKPSTLENIIRVQLNLPYAVSDSKKEDKMIDGKRVTKRYIVITKII